MRVSEVEEYIVRVFFAPRRGEKRYGLLFLGPPGVGKSSVVFSAAARIAEKLGKELLRLSVRWSPERRTFVVGGKYSVEEVLKYSDRFFVVTDFRLSSVEPSDLSGVMRSRDGIAFYDPLFWAVVHSANPGILFLDEITWIQRDDVFSIVPQVVLDRVAGLTEFHPDTLVIAAGNRPEDDRGFVRVLHNALKCRFKVIRVTTSLEDWRRYMEAKYGDNWDKRVYAFLLRFKEEGYLSPPPRESEGIESFPTPRNWTWLALDLFDGFDSEDDIIGLLGEEVGRKFIGFLKVSVPLEELLDEPEKFHGLSFDAKYMVPVMLASHISEKPRDAKAIRLAVEMSKESAEFLLLLLSSLKGAARLTVAKEVCKAEPELRKVLAGIYADLKEAGLS